MINLIKLQCPNCNANLEVKDDTKQCFCTYCGTKILLQNDNEYYIHHIDEARIKEAEVQHEIARMQFQEQQIRREQEAEANIEAKKRIRKKRISAFFIALVSGFILTGLSGSPIMFLIALAVGIKFMVKDIPEKEQDKALAERGYARFPKSLGNINDRTYSVLLSELETVGFTNITCENLHDVKFGMHKNEGKVEKILLNNGNPSRGKLYPQDVPILIVYHGR